MVLVVAVYAWNGFKGKMVTQWLQPGDFVQHWSCFGWKVDKVLYGLNLYSQPEHDNQSNYHSLSSTILREKYVTSVSRTYYWVYIGPISTHNQIMLIYLAITATLH